MATSFLSRKVDEGVQQGLQQGQIELIQSLLEQQFGPLNAPIRQKLSTYSKQQLIDQIQNAFEG